MREEGRSHCKQVLASFSVTGSMWQPLLRLSPHLIYSHHPHHLTGIRSTAVPSMPYLSCLRFWINSEKGWWRNQWVFMMHMDDIILYLEELQFLLNSGCSITAYGLCTAHLENSLGLWTTASHSFPHWLQEAKTDCRWFISLYLIFSRYPKHPCITHHPSSPMCRDHDTKKVHNAHRNRGYAPQPWLWAKFPLLLPSNSKLKIGAILIKNFCLRTFYLRSLL